MQTSSEVQLYLPRVVAEWSQLAVGPPWVGLTESQRIDFLPKLVEALLRATVCTPPQRPARTQAVHAAAHHGTERRAQGFTEVDLVLEYYLIRLAVWTASRAGAAIRLRPLASTRADAMLSVLALATLDGFENESNGHDARWTDALDLLLADV